MSPAVAKGGQKPFVRCLKRTLRVLGSREIARQLAFIEGWKGDEAAPAIELYNGLAFRWLKQMRDGMGLRLWKQACAHLVCP